MQMSRASVVAGDGVVHPLPECVFVPLVAGEQLLEGARRDAGCEGHGLDALLGEVGELAADLDGQVLARIATGVAVPEASEVLVEPGLEGSDLGHIHAETPDGDNTPQKVCPTRPVRSRSHRALSY